MTRYIRRAALLCALLLVALLVNVVRVQLVRSETYSGNPANRRTDIARWGQPRGDILVGGRPVTGSRDTGGLFRYARTYTDGPLYAPVTGFASQVYGSTLLEHARDGLLAGTDPGLAALPCCPASPAPAAPAARWSRRSTRRPSARPTKGWPGGTGRWRPWTR